jgi:hypothetical protein
MEQIETSSRPLAAQGKNSDMPPKPKRKLLLYIPKIMADLIWATTKDSTTVHLGFEQK